jgi:hypothetical protein
MNQIKPGLRRQDLEKNTSNMADVSRRRHRVTSLQVLYANNVDSVPVIDP